MIEVPLAIVFNAALVLRGDRFHYWKSPIENLDERKILNDRGKP